MFDVRSNDISLKYQRCTTLGSKDIGIINSEFVAKTQFLCDNPKQLLWLICFVYMLWFYVCLFVTDKRHDSVEPSGFKTYMTPGNC